MVQRPPEPTLFPYTRSSDLQPLARRDARRGRGTARRVRAHVEDARHPRLGRGRSEEHTSELQSPDHLVCRLLLEKKKRSPAASSFTRPSKPPIAPPTTKIYP